MLGRPINPGRHPIEEIQQVDLLDEVDDDISGLAVRPEPTWYVQMEPGDVRAVTAEQLRDFYRLGLIGRDTYLWQPAMQQWLQLSAFLGNEEPAEKEDEWHVRMGPGDVRKVSLEQLDDFYRLGVVDGQTLVWQAGMANWAKLADLIGEESDEAEDVWYALMPSGEAKQLTLEQLDDFYRVDVITERTPVWKEGMNQWLPLGTVAGIASPSPASASPAAAVAAKPAPTPPASVKPGPVAVSTWPAAPAAAQTGLAAMQQPMPVLSAPPLAVSIAPQTKPSAGGRWLVRLCVAAGVLISLQRNDVLFSAAQAYRQQDKFAQLERETLGGPGFGTLRAVDQLIASAGGSVEPVRLPWIVQERHERALRESSGPAKPQNSLATADKDLARAKQSSDLNPIQAKSEPSPSKTAELNKAPATLSALGAAKKSVATKAPAPRPARKAATKSSKSVFRARGDANDPLNGAL